MDSPDALGLFGFGDTVIGYWIQLFLFFRDQHISIFQTGSFLIIPIYFLVKALVILTFTLSKWNGDMKRRLLLRLIRE